jgi:hypothetical protein
MISRPLLVEWQLLGPTWMGRWLPGTHCRKHINSWNLWMISGIYTEFMDVFDFFFIPPKNGIGIETWPYYFIYIYHYLYIQNDQNEHIA